MDSHVIAGWLAMLLAAFGAVTLATGIIGNLITPPAVWDEDTREDMPASQIRRSWSLYWSDIALDAAFLAVMVWVLLQTVPDLLLPLLTS